VEFHEATSNEALSHAAAYPSFSFIMCGEIKQRQRTTHDDITDKKA